MDKNPHLEITKLVLGHINIVNKYFKERSLVVSDLRSESCMHLFLINDWTTIRYLNQKFYIIKNF